MALVAGNRGTFVHIIHISLRYLPAKIKNFKEKRKLIQKIIFLPHLTTFQSFRKPYALYELGSSNINT